jgi:hypothetical protein
MGDETPTDAHLLVQGYSARMARYTIDSPTLLHLVAHVSGAIQRISWLPRTSFVLRHCRCCLQQ